MSPRNAYPKLYAVFATPKVELTHLWLKERKYTVVVVVTKL